MKKKILSALGIVGLVSAAVFIGTYDPKTGIPAPITVNGETIEFTWTDNNSGENLIIYTDKATYTDGLSHAKVYVAVTNTSGVDQDIELMGYFRDDKKRIRDVKVLAEVTKEVEEPIYKEECKTVKVASSSKNTQECTQVVDRVNKSEVKYLDWLNLETKERTIAEKTKELLAVDLGRRKTVENFIASKKTDGYFVPAGGVVYFKVMIDFPAQSDDNFYFEAIGSEGAYGNLDPWFDSSWAYRIKVEVAPSQVGSSTAITNFPVYVDLSLFPDSFFSNASTADIRVTESDGVTETPFEVVSFGIQYFNAETQNIDTSTSTWRLPTYALSDTATVEVWGAGGGGGDGSNTGGGGGGGGAYASSSLVLSTTTDYAITIGAGGAKGGTTAAGGFGATTTFNGTQVVAQGGRGGLGCSAANCAGGSGGLATASIGSSTYNGGTGGTSNNSGDIGGGGGGAAGSTGTGGNASGQTAGAGAGNGGAGGAGGANAGSGANGSVPGGGGGGGENNSVGSTGNGANGRVSITYTVATTSQKFGELHLLADGLSTTSSSTFYVYYGNPSASPYAPTDTYGRNAVWSNYSAVWHMDDTTTSTFTDSTSNSFLANKKGANEPLQTTGKINKAQDFDGANDFANVTHSATLSPTGNMTIQAWAKSGVVSGHMVGKDNESNFRREGWLLVSNVVSSNLRFNFTAGLNSGYPQVESTDQLADTWTMIHGTYIPSTELRIYINGISNNVSTTSIPASLAAVTRELNFGRRNNGFGPDRFFDGDVDEVRLIASTLTPDWILTEYNNQSSPATFFYIGPEETDGGGGGGATSTDSGVIWFD